MRRPLLVLSLALLLSACLAEAPDIDVVSGVDLGSIVKGDVATATLAVRNSGGAPLVIQSVSTSCGCTTATIEPMTIPAGGKGILHIAYDSNAHAEDAGPIRRHVFIASNDPDEDDTRVELLVEVRTSP